MLDPTLTLLLSTFTMVAGVVAAGGMALLLLPWTTSEIEATHDECMNLFRPEARRATLMR
ncbi:MAG: hypothetical protein QGG40_18795 [Myxococcota bacterium]|jgi:hypothetical protein|nr:hypothetical protein [Myxococcota bacterium]